MPHILCHMRSLSEFTGDLSSNFTNNLSMFKLRIEPRGMRYPPVRITSLPLRILAAALNWVVCMKTIFIFTPIISTEISVSTMNLRWERARRQNIYASLLGKKRVTLAANLWIAIHGLRYHSSIWKGRLNWKAIDWSIGGWRPHSIPD